jgi:glycosyltransferase involved in cell wall biosynthesis
LRLKGIKTICIVDNLFPHESNKCDSILARIFFKYIYAVVTQSEIVHEQFLLFSPNTPEIMVPHPVYDQFGPSVPMNLAREKLNIEQNKKVLLFFGFIRPYKGLDTLLSIMPKLIKKYSNIHLLIA